jgi:hypothetical protein
MAPLILEIPQGHSTFDMGERSQSILFHYEYKLCTISADQVPESMEVWDLSRN